jgi:hypothetical protein
MAHTRKSSENDSTRCDKDHVPIRLTPEPSVLRRQRMQSARHLTCSVSAELRSTRLLNEVTSNGQVRQEDFVLRCRSCLVSDAAQAHGRSEGGPRWSRGSWWLIGWKRAFDDPIPLPVGANSPRLKMLGPTGFRKDHSRHRNHCADANGEVLDR